MRSYSKLVFLIAAALGGDVQAQVYPLSQNSWDNPEFVNRFLGSYGVNTRLEPDISREEATLFNELADLISSDPVAATARLRGAITAESSAALDYTLASLLLQEGNYEQAVGNYKTAILKFPNFMRAYKNLGLAHVQAGNFTDALPMLVKAIELGDGDGNTYGLLGYAYLNTDKPQAALDAYRIAYVLRPENRDWKIGVAQGLNLTGKYDEGAAVLRELIQDYPDYIPFYINRSNALIALGREMQAASHLEIVKRMGKADVASLRLLGDIYLNAFMPRLAVDNYLAALRDDNPISKEGALIAARNLVTFGAFKEADVFISAIQETEGENLNSVETVTLLNLSAEIALAAGNDAEASQILEKVVEEDPLNGRALLLLGNFNNRMGDFEQAEFFYERASEIGSVQVDALIQHDRMLVGNRNYSGAVRLLERAQGLRPSTNVENYLNAVRSARDLQTN